METDWKDSTTESSLTCVVLENYFLWENEYFVVFADAGKVLRDGHRIQRIMDA